ncbi:hypothetical protein SLA2020_422890 [Shorea laevis]
MEISEAAASTPSKVSPKTVEKALGALLKWRDSRSKEQKPQLLEQDEFVYLILTLKKIPQNSRVNAYKIPLPHPLINPTQDFSELCLIIDDRSKSGLTKDDAAKKIKAENIPISKVLKLSKLKTDYRPFEAKRKLCDSYDMFFADRRVVPLLPKLLGKQFFKKKKIPVPLDLKHKNWKEQIDNVCRSALLYFSTGTCSVVKVGRLSMESNEILANVMAAINGIAEVVPRKWANIRSIHLKLLESLALPIYQTVPDLRLKIEAYKKNGEVVDGAAAKDDEDKDNTVVHEKNKKKGRIHEVRYMDSNISETLDEDEIGSDFEGDVTEGGDFEGDISEGEDSEDDVRNVDFGDKKRKKEGQMKSEKVARKVAKVKRGDGGIKQKGEKDEQGARQKKGKDKSGGEEEKKEKKKSATKLLKSGEMKLKDKKKKKIALAK